MSSPFKYYLSNERPFSKKRGALNRRMRSLNISLREGALIEGGALSSKYGILKPKFTNSTDFSEN